MLIKRKIESEDNISEILSMVIDFGCRRHQLLRSNIASIEKSNFVPLDFPVGEFTELINSAVAEHICSERLLLKDSENIKFGRNGDFEVIPVEDAESLKLFKKDIKAYLELQASKISENEINLRKARELLAERQNAVTPLSI